MRRKTWHERTGRLFVRRFTDGNLRGCWGVDCPCCGGTAVLGRWDAALKWARGHISDHEG